MNKKANPKEENVYSISKKMNVFSTKEFEKEYIRLISNVFGVSVTAAKIYKHIYLSEKIDKHVYVNDKDVANKFPSVNKTNFAKYMSELIVSGLVTESDESNLFCMNPEMPFDPDVHDNIKLTITIEKKSTITESAVAETEASGKPIANSKEEDKADMINFLKEKFIFSDEEITKIGEVFDNKNLNSKKFYAKISEWQSAMRPGSTDTQKKNYLSACLLNEDWSAK